MQLEFKAVGKSPREKLQIQDFPMKSKFELKIIRQKVIKYDSTKQDFVAMSGGQHGLTDLDELIYQKDCNFARIEVAKNCSSSKKKSEYSKSGIV